jgi:multiple sugar transport system ATP-binding protein
MNLLEAEVLQRGAELEIAIGRESVRLDESEQRRWADAVKRHVGRKVVVGVRPESLEDATLVPDNLDGRRFSARAELVETLGSEVVVHLGVDARPVVTDDVREIARDVDEAVVEDLERQRAAHRAICVGRFAPSTTIRKGDTVMVAIKRGSLHFFDVESGRAL